MNIQSVRQLIHRVRLGERARGTAMLTNRELPSWSTRTRLFLVIGLSLVLSGCIGTKRPPVSELDSPTWEIGQEWHYKGSNGQWQNWTVVGTEERRGYETYKIRVNLSPADSFGREVRIRWYDQQTLGMVENQNGEDRGDASGGWGEEPLPPRFPLRLGNSTYSVSATLYTPDQTWERELNGVIRVHGWTTTEVMGSTTEAVHITNIDPDTNRTQKYWYSPPVENWGRYWSNMDNVHFELKG